MASLNYLKGELLDVVDKNDVIIGSGSRDDVHHLGFMHREIHVWLFDELKNIYFQKSPPHKSSAGLLDASIGGHVDKGEDYLSAAIRETREESGLLIKSSSLIFLTKFSGISEHKKRGTVNNFIRSVYICKNPVTGDQLKHDPAETDGGFHKFSFNFLSNLSKNDTLLFHKFVPTDELPLVLNYLKNTI